MKIHKKKTQHFFQDQTSPNKGSSPVQMAPVQKMDAKGEEEVQMKKAPVQMMESGEREGEEIQMKKGPVQMMESPELEEEEVQMKKGPVQMMESAEHEEEELQMKRGPVQMMESPEMEEEEVQMKKGPVQMLESAEQEDEELQMKAGSGSSNVASDSETSGNPMPQAVKVKMEAAFNADFSNVKIHESDKAASIGALAYTQGEDIHFAPGKYNPNSKEGQELLGHELAHVLQQREGRVKETKQAKGLSVNDDQTLENEADKLGFLAAHSPDAGGE